ncbi:hypothetical protein [Limnohabitans sp.]|uniref:hypothetical protein n=1 Tax=Limnohabitans sp. TaxID=1907725 RepID=UPI00286EC4D2|nr:hypothetical protein [Limnohabitans sp.]
MTTPEQQSAQDRLAAVVNRRAEREEQKNRGVDVPWVTATLTRCRHGAALVELTSEPFNGMEIRPSALREMAQRLTAIADMAVKLPTGGKHFKPTTVVVGKS